MLCTGGIARHALALRRAGGRCALACMVLLAGRDDLGGAVVVRGLRREEAERNLPPPEEGEERGQALHAVTVGYPERSQHANATSARAPAALRRSLVTGIGAGAYFAMVAK